MSKHINLIFILLILPTVFATAEISETPATLSHTIILERTKEIDQLLLLIQKKLVLSHEIAKSKWNHNEEISSSEDKLYLRKIAKLSAAYGLNKDWTQTFFLSLSEAERMLQKYDFENWIEDNAGEFEGTADYHTEIKPYSDRLNKEILQALVATSPYLAEERTHDFIFQKPLLSRPEDFIPEDVWLKAVEPLYNFSP